MGLLRHDACLGLGLAWESAKARWSVSADTFIHEDAPPRDKNHNSINLLCLRLNLYNAIYKKRKLSAHLVSPFPTSYYLKMVSKSI